MPGAAATETAWPTEPNTLLLPGPLWKKFAGLWYKGSNGAEPGSPDKGSNPSSANAGPQGRDLWGFILITCRVGLPTEPPVIKR